MAIVSMLSAATIRPQKIHRPPKNKSFLRKKLTAKYPRTIIPPIPTKSNIKYIIVIHIVGISGAYLELLGIGRKIISPPS